VLVYYISCKWCTVRVGVGEKSGRIIDTAPVVGRFLGRKLEDLTDWLKADIIERIR